MMLNELRLYSILHLLVFMNFPYSPKERSVVWNMKRRWIFISSYQAQNWIIFEEMNDTSSFLNRFLYYLVRGISYGLLNVILCCLVNTGSKGCEEVLSALNHEQRECKSIHVDILKGVWTLFLSTLLCLLASRYIKMIFIRLIVNIAIKSCCYSQSGKIQLSFFRLLHHRSFEQKVSIVLLDNLWKYLHGIGGFCHLISLLNYCLATGTNRVWLFAY